MSEEQDRIRDSIGQILIRRIGIPKISQTDSIIALHNTAGAINEIIALDGLGVIADDQSSEDYPRTASELSRNRTGTYWRKLVEKEEK